MSEVETGVLLIQPTKPLAFRPDNPTQSHNAPGPDVLLTRIDEPIGSTTIVLDEEFQHDEVKVSPKSNGERPLPNLDDLSAEQLKQLQEEIERKAAEKAASEKQGVIQQIVDVANQFNVTIDELIEAFGGFKPKRKGVPAKAKYLDPSTGITWSGRGKEPTWLRGKDRTKFLIKD